MRIAMTVLAALFLVALAAFCLFGFLASFEPTDHPRQFLAFRVGYAVLGIACLAAIAALFFRK